jgi:hypothetical protein
MIPHLICEICLLRSNTGLTHVPLIYRFKWLNGDATIQASVIFLQCIHPVVISECGYESMPSLLNPFRERRYSIYTDEVIWQKPDERWMKLNVDGSCIAAMGQTSVKCRMQVGTMLEKSCLLPCKL